MKGVGFGARPEDNDKIIAFSPEFVGDKCSTCGNSFAENEVPGFQDDMVSKPVHRKCLTWPEGDD